MPHLRVLHFSCMFSFLTKQRQKTSTIGKMLIFLGVITCVFSVAIFLAPELILVLLPSALGVMGLTFLALGWAAAR